MARKAFFIKICVTGFIAVFLLTSGLYAGTGNEEDDQKQWKKGFDFGGSLLGVAHSITQDDRADTAPKKNQFDLAGNLEIQWRVSKKLRVSVQIQGGPGEGNLGFAGSSLVVTDLNVEWDLSRYLSFTFGSFDTPFGVSTFSLTNNGDGSKSLFILNSLFYSAFADTNVGTLNTVGMKFDWDMPVGVFTVAITNGTDEAAFNPDGNLEVVLMLQTKPILGGLTFAGSYIKSKDASLSGSSGSGSDFSGWMVDAGYNYKDKVIVEGYYGGLTYGDENPGTGDDVVIWKAQARWNVMKKVYLAFRVSGWEPDGGNGGLVSPFIPRPGLVNPDDTLIPDTERGIRRLQLGGGYRFSDHLVFRLEYIHDKYEESLLQGNVDSRGFMAAMNVLF